jgi:hypothetical protein
MSVWRILDPADLADLQGQPCISKHPRQPATNPNVPFRIKAWNQMRTDFTKTAVDWRYWLNMTRRHHSKRFTRVGAILWVLAWTPSLACGQQQLAPSTQQSTSAQSQSNSTPQSQPEKSREQKQQEQEQKSGTSNDRLFFALPNFLTIENADQVPPLTAKQKFAVVARGTFDWVEFPWYGALAGISQAENSEPGYGQGAEGYAKRYGAAFADGSIENFFTGAILPSVLRQDPRFYQMPTGSFGGRALYAASRIVITRSDSGHRQFNFSEIIGSALSAAISTYSYHPRADKTLANTASVWGTQVGYDTLTLEVKEFWPDIRRMIYKKKDSKSSQAP